MQHLEDREITCWHEGGHFLAAHLLGLTVEHVRIGRQHDDTSNTLGEVALLEGLSALTDDDFVVVVSAGAGAQWLAGMPITPVATRGDQALLAARGLAPAIVPILRLFELEKDRLSELVSVLRSKSSAGTVVLDGSGLHSNFEDSFGSWTAQGVLSL